MPERYTIDKATVLDRRLRLVLAANLVVATVPLLAWRQLSRYLIEPMRWATWAELGANPGLFDYPFAMLWGLPLAGLGAGWTLRKGGSRRTAMWIACFPLLYLGTLIAGFHIVPRLMN